MASRVFYLDEMGMKGDALIGGALNPNATDNTPAWNAAMAAAKYGDEYHMPVGYSGFKSRPATFPSQCRLVGRGAYSSFVKNYNSPGSEIFLNIGSSYPNLERLHFYQGYGYTGGTAWGHIATGPGLGLYGLNAEHITVSKFTTNWNTGVILDGTRGTPYYDSRSIYIDHLFIGAAVNDIAVLLAGLEGGANIDRLFITNGRLVLTGDADNRCSLLNISGGNSGNINMSYTLSSRLNFAAIGSVDIDYTCASVTVESAFHNAIPTVAGANNRVASGKYEWKSAG